VADVAVVGGGILGATAALHLAREGADVILLERQPALGTQTTRAGAASSATGRASWRRRWPRILLAEDDPDMRGLVASMLRRNGYQVVAVASGVEMLRQEYERELHFAPDVVMLDEAEALRAAPILAPGSVHAALFQPDAYQVDTGRVMRALDGELRAAGVDVRTGTAVTGAVVESGRVTGVRTSAGTVAAGAMVNAAGAAARALARATASTSARSAARVALHHRADRRRHPRAADDAVLRARPALPARAGRRPAGGAIRRTINARRRCGRSAVHVRPP
jgi:D-arginine dehydrogenase